MFVGAMPVIGETIFTTEEANKVVARICGIIDSMNKQERRDPTIIDASRCRRIAAGCSVEAHQVTDFLAKFKHLQEWLGKALNFRP
jgi:signal recognition particle subunit SRP54